MSRRLRWLAGAIPAPLGFVAKVLRRLRDERAGAVSIPTPLPAPRS